MTIQPALFAASPAARAKPMSDWLLRHLDADGVIDLAAGASRRARPAKCRRCQGWVVRGLDADWCAQSADCDLEPLTPVGEALALLAGRRTYSLCQWGGRFELDQRDSMRIASHPAGTERGTDILAEHDCAHPLALPHRPSNIPPPPSSAPLPDQPPF